MFLATSFSIFLCFLSVPAEHVGHVFPPPLVPSVLPAGARGAHLPDVNILQGEAGEECAAPSPAQVINPCD